MHRGRLPACCCRHRWVDGLQRPSGRNASHAKTPSPITSPTDLRSRTEISPGTRAHHTQPLHRAHSPPTTAGAHPPQQQQAHLDARAPAQISSNPRRSRTRLDVVVGTVIALTPSVGLRPPSPWEARRGAKRARSCRHPWVKLCQPAMASLLLFTRGAGDRGGRSKGVPLLSCLHAISCCSAASVSRRLAASAPPPCRLSGDRPGARALYQAQNRRPGAPSVVPTPLGPAGRIAPGSRCIRGHAAWFLGDGHGSALSAFRRRGAVLLARAPGAGAGGRRQRVRRRAAGGERAWMVGSPNGRAGRCHTRSPARERGPGCAGHGGACAGQPRLA
jgi:hypothetical protein